MWRGVVQRPAKMKTDLLSVILKRIGTISFISQLCTIHKLRLPTQPTSAMLLFDRHSFWYQNNSKKKKSNGIIPLSSNGSIPNTPSVNSFIFAHFDRNDTTFKCHLLSSSIKRLIKSVLHTLCAKSTPSLFVLFFLLVLYLFNWLSKHQLTLQKRNLAFWSLNCSIWDFRVLLIARAICNVCTPMLL